MPNPFARLHPQNLSKNPPRDRVIDPVPEKYEGYNNPYRGTEMHGVEPTEDPRATPDHSSGRDVVYDEPLPEPEPIPVVVRTTGGREFRRSRIFQGKANARNPSRVVGKDESRIKVKLKNLGASVVYVGNNDTTANVNEGWPLAQNEVYESETQDELFALSSHAADPMTVAVTVIYSAEL